MITVTILSISLNARKFFEFQLNHDKSDYETTSLMEYPPYIVFSNTWQELIVTGALPFLVLIICNINIYLKIRESSKHENHRLVRNVCLFLKLKSQRRNFMIFLLLKFYVKSFLGILEAQNLLFLPF